ncbi:MAG: hypothetical protein ACPGJS_00700 [Flammeovirgaceae bacterium]
MKDLDLTEKDFDLLIQGLENLPNKGQIVEFMGDLLGTMLAKDNEQAMDEFKMDREKERQERELKQKELNEDIGILKGKLLMFKRYLKNNKILD